MSVEFDFEIILEAMKKAAGALRDADIPFSLGGGLAVWARGGARTEHDVDFFVKPDDAERAQQALVDAGLEPETPPEGWLLKAWDGDVLVDLIWDLEGLDDPEALLARADDLSVRAVRMPVLALDDVIVSMLCALDEHSLDLAGPLAIARALREQIDWRDIRDRTAHSPYARGFLALLEALDIVAPAAAGRADQPRVRVVPGG
jgi:hypothetical protein